jgi:hypothetical protein
MDLLSKDSRRIRESPGFTDKIHFFVHFWDVKDCKESPDSLFIYGDNDIKRGSGGQAVIRNCINSIGIPTKKYPSYKNEAYYTDTEYTENRRKILHAIERIIIASVRYKELIFPMNGFGTGLSRLQEKAPKTLQFLNEVIKEIFGIEYRTVQNNNMDEFDDEK